MRTFGTLAIFVLSLALGASAALGDGDPKKKKAKGVREKIITREATLKSKDQTKLDFDSVDIGGQRKTPMGTLVGQSKADKNYDFVKIRTNWHPEMVQSASTLDTGTPAQ